MSLYAQFGTDTKAEVEGTDITFAANSDGSIPTFRVARMGGSNKRYLASLTRKTRSVQTAIRNGTLPDEQAKRISMEVFIETVLLGWSNVYDRTGTLITYTPNAAQWLFNELPDLYDEIVRQAGSLTTFQTAELEDIAKN
jgi:hypothetical protein